MIVSPKNLHVIPLPKRIGMDFAGDAAQGIDGGSQSLMALALQNHVQSQVSSAAERVSSGEADDTREVVSNAAAVSDHVNEAFAKTRVHLFATESVKANSQHRGPNSSTTDEFNDYMSKSPEERYRHNILRSKGLTEDGVRSMPPEQQQAISQQTAQRVEEKMKMDQVDENNGKRERNNTVQEDESAIASG